MAYFSEKRIQSACGHTVFGMTMFAGTFVIPPLFAPIWICHLIIAFGDVLLGDKSDTPRR